MFSREVSLMARAFLRVAIILPAVQVVALAFWVIFLAFSPGGETTSLLTRFADGNVPILLTITAIASLLFAQPVPLLIGQAARRFMDTQAALIDVAALRIKMTLLIALSIVLRRLAPFCCGRWQSRPINRLPWCCWRRRST